MSQGPPPLLPGAAALGLSPPQPTGGTALLINLGMDTPTKRFFYTFVLGVLIEYFIKPSYAYTDKGHVRPWILTHGASAPNATYIPVFLLPVLAGGFMSVFI